MKLFPYTTLFRSAWYEALLQVARESRVGVRRAVHLVAGDTPRRRQREQQRLRLRPGFGERFLAPLAPLHERLVSHYRLSRAHRQSVGVPGTLRTIFAPARARADMSHDEPTDRREPAPDAGSDAPIRRRPLGVILAVFAILGVGIGLTGYLMIGALGGGGGSQLFSGLFALVVILFAALVGPVVAVAVTLHVDESLGDALGPASLTAAVGNFVGFLVMGLLVVILLSIRLSGGGGGGEGGGSLDVGSYVGTLVKAGFPSLLVAVAVTALTRRT